MSQPLKILLSLICVSCAGALAYLFWSPHIALLVIVLLLVGIALGNFSSSKRNEAGTTLIPLTTERAAQEAPSRALLEAMVNGVRAGVVVIDEGMRGIASDSAAINIFKRVEAKREALR